MADLSLDEFIKQKNVKVQIRNAPSRGPTPKGVMQRWTLKPNPKFQTKSVQRTFDARSKLGPKTVPDARDKIIINKKSGKGDARNKIVQKQVQKGTFDARSILQKQPKSTNGAVAPKPLMPITRTLSNPSGMGQLFNPSGMGQLFNPSGMGQQPGTHVSFSGNSLQITKRGLGRPPQPPQPAPSIVKDSVPIIQIRNDRYQQRQQIHHPPWPQLSQPLPAQPAQFHQSPSYPFSSSHPSQRYQDLDNLNHLDSSLSVHNVPKINVSNFKTVEAAGMRPVSVRPVSLHQKAPPGAATLSAKPPGSVSQSGAMKRRQPPVQEVVGGPLKLGKGGGPGLQVGIGAVSPPKRAKGMHSTDPIEITELDDNSKFVSPIQGFRVIVTNLFTGVTQEDIIELFGVVGPLKKARLLKAGSAEVVYTLREDALKAVQKYHGRELDGQPMYVKMTTPSAAVVKFPIGKDPDITGEALRLYKKPSSLGALPRAPVEVPTIQRALFKVGPPAPNKSVKFTVKI